MANEFLCVGGPFNGQKKAWEDVSATYWGYNRAGGVKEIPSYVFIHESLLNASKAPKLSSMPRRRKASAPRNQDMQVWEVERQI
jgi:hypothetical protein